MNTSMKILWTKANGDSHDGAALINQAAKEPLYHRVMDEAAHQLRRGIYFTSILPVGAGILPEKAAKRGLNALERECTAEQICESMSPPPDDAINISPFENYRK